MNIDEILQNVTINEKTKEVSNFTETQKLAYCCNEITNILYLHKESIDKLLILLQEIYDKQKIFENKLDDLENKVSLLMDEL